MTLRRDTRPAQEIIKTALQKSGYKEIWLADRIGMNPKTLNSRLNSAKTFPHQLYLDIMDVFRKYDIISEESEQCDMIIDRVNEWNGIIGSSLSLMSRTISDTITDKILDMEDQKKLLKAVDEVEAKVVKKLDEIRRLIEG
ncbi:MAG TPA: hypothetical protein VHO03_05735 [Ignavibacteriales bacterium]|nr:hypothetical protein [Ignavibacteriales bacterium]